MISEFERKTFWLLAKLSHCFKKCLPSLHRILMRKKILQKFFSSWVFSDFEREIFQTLAKFYPSVSWKMQCMPPVEPFEKMIKLQNYCKSSFLRLSKSFWEFWHKLLAWLSNFLSTWTTSVIIIFPTLFQRTTFQIFSEFFFDRAHKHAIFVSGVFSLESINFEKSCCFFLFFFISECERKIFGFC